MAEIDQTERAYRAAVYEVDGIGPARMKVLLSAFGSAEKVWGTNEKKLREIGLSETIVSEIRKKRATVEPKNHLAALAKLGIRVLVIEDEEYPELLKKIDDSPQVLFVRGHFDASDARAIAVVGTRKPTAYGREVTERLVEELVGSPIGRRLLAEGGPLGFWREGWTAFTRRSMWGLRRISQSTERWFPNLRRLSCRYRGIFR